MERIPYLVHSLGIGRHYQGQRYLVMAMTLCFISEDYLLGVSKVLYPKIAHDYHTTAGSVERDLRTVINVCWKRGNRQLLESISPYTLTKCPTISQFLDITTGYLKQTSAP